MHQNITKIAETLGNIGREFPLPIKVTTKEPNIIDIDTPKVPHHKALQDILDFVLRSGTDSKSVGRNRETQDSNTTITIGDKPEEVLTKLGAVKLSIESESQNKDVFLDLLDKLNANNFDANYVAAFGDTDNPTFSPIIKLEMVKPPGKDQEVSTSFGINIFTTNYQFKDALQTLATKHQSIKIIPSGAGFNIAAVGENVLKAVSDLLSSKEALKAASRPRLEQQPEPQL